MRAVCTGRGKCGTVNDHELFVLVGYGYDYYVLKNSFGEDWGRGLHAPAARSDLRAAS
jgi:hypothetical protein